MGWSGRSLAGVEDAGWWQPQPPPRPSPADVQADVEEGRGLGGGGRLPLQRPPDQLSTVTAAAPSRPPLHNQPAAVDSVIIKRIAHQRATSTTPSPCC